MFCTKCGNKLADDARFCVKCGTTVNTASVPNTQLQAGSFGDVTPEQMKVNIAQGYTNQTHPTIPSSIVPQYIPPIDNLLIAMIVLSTVTIILTGLAVAVGLGG